MLNKCSPFKVDNKSSLPACINAMSSLIAFLAMLNLPQEKQGHVQNRLEEYSKNMPSETQLDPWGASRMS